VATLGDDDQCTKWLPRMVAGELIGAIAMTEPGAGSDLLGIRTAGRRVNGGWIVDGAKNLYPQWHPGRPRHRGRAYRADAGSRGFSLLVVERRTAGFSADAS
jgi:long-chain-acyl-CoA dehydrogenase